MQKNKSLILLITLLFVSAVTISGCGPYMPLENIIPSNNINQPNTDAIKEPARERILYMVNDHNDSYIGSMAPDGSESNVVTAYNDRIQFFTPAPNGRAMVIGITSKEANVRTEIFGPKDAFLEHTLLDNYTDLSFSEDGKVIAIAKGHIYCHIAGNKYSIGVGIGGPTIAVSPDGKYVVFSGTGIDKYGIPNWDVRSLDIAPTSNTDLYGHPSISFTTSGKDKPDWGAAWAHSGNRIAFFSQSSKGASIYTNSSDGRSLTKFTELGDLQPEGELCWSPDDSCLIFSARKDGNLDIWSISTTNKEITRLTNTPENEENPVWLTTAF